MTLYFVVHCLTSHCPQEPSGRTSQCRSTRVGYILAVLLSPLVVSQVVLGQKIETVQPDRHRIVRLETALNHLTVIEVREPVTMVAAGSQSFKIERRENKVFVQPLEENVSTNLFVWTSGARYNYELVPAGQISDMHFAVDQDQPFTAESDPAKSDRPSLDPGEVARTTLLESKPVRTSEIKFPRDRVSVVLKDVLRTPDCLFIRYTIQNYGRGIYRPEGPQIAALVAPRMRRSLFALSNTQLEFKEIPHNQGKVRIEPIHSQMRSTMVRPGEEAVGVIGIKVVEGFREPNVLQFSFPADLKGRVTAILVL
jgi:conjugative transfer protein CagX